MGTYSAWESTATLRLLCGARSAWAPTGGGEGRGHSVSPRAQLVVRTAALLHSLTCRILSVLVTECEMFVRSQWLLCVYLRVRVSVYVSVTS